jgi:hypothetical protein
MADYYELIAKAVASLDPDAPSESRLALYERAQAALLAKLRSITPPFTEAEITRERLALEEAVRRVEDEASQRDRDARAPFRDHLSAFSDLVTDADELGKTSAEARRRHYLLQANALEIGRMANPSSLNVESMIVTGDATGILGRIWRWRSRVSR